MKIHKVLLIFFFLFIFLLGFALGLRRKSTQNRSESPKTNPLIRTCEYNGKVYQSGEGFKDEDGCNTCSCEDGQVSCTMMFCAN